MKTLRSSFLFLGLVFLICLIAPAASFAQEDPIPPCCFTNAVILIPLDDGTIIIILDPDTVTPSDEDQTTTDPVAQLLSTDAPALLPASAVDRSRFAMVSEEVRGSIREMPTQQA